MEWAAAILAQIFAAGAVYGAIRADLNQLRSGVDRAHQRLDEILIREGKR